MPEDAKTPTTGRDGKAEPASSTRQNHVEKTDRWDKVRILLNGFGTPVTVALVGLLVSSYLDRQQTMDTNARAFAELINHREEADTNLRKEMFTTVLENFFRGGGDVRDDILKLEILAYNFHQSLDLSPVFQDVLRRIDPPGTESGSAQLSRLTKLAREVVFKQVEALRYAVGVTREGAVDFLNLDKHPEGIVLFDDTLALQPYYSSVESEPRSRRYRVEVLDKSIARRELLVRLVAWPAGQAVGDSEVDVQFTLGFFDFPGIDNTRLSNGERCALVLQELHDEWAQVQLVVFPGSRAGLKDSMYVEDFVREMLKVRDQR